MSSADDDHHQQHDQRASMSIAIMIIVSDTLMITITTPLSSHLERLPVAAFDPSRFGAATRPGRPGGGVTVNRRDRRAFGTALASALDLACAAQLGRFEAMLLQQLSHGAQDIGPVLTLLRPLFGLQQRKLMPQIGDATIQARNASGCIELRGLGIHSSDSFSKVGVVPGCGIG
jgi:hypothetical protein